MYKVLFVDDEDLIREAISRKIKWDTLGYELCKTCRNGKEAIEYISNNEIDLLITDICMPYVDGIELSKYVCENHPKIKTIILSGYNEFDYAKNAMKYKVIDYVLKPVTGSELTDILNELYKTLQEEEAKNTNMKRLREEYKKNIPILRSRYLNQIIQGQQTETTDEEVKIRLSDFGYEIEGVYYKITLIDENSEIFFQNNNGAKKDLPSFIVYNIVEEIVRTKKYGITFQNIHGKTVVIFADHEKEKLNKNIADIFKESTSVLKEYFNINIGFGTGKLIENLCNSKLSYEGAESALDYQFIYGNDKIIDVKDLGTMRKESDIDIGGEINNLVISIKTGSKEEIKFVLGQILNKFIEEKISKNKVYIYTQNIVVALGNLIDNSDLKEDNVMEEQEQLMYMLHEEKTAKAVFDILESFCIKLAETMMGQKNRFGTKQAVLAQEYIDKHYGDEQLSLQMICAELAISPSYFSSVFKSYTGETFVEALTKKRINKAKELLCNTTMKNYEIAEKVGYSDPHYFAITFKKITGMTPKEYAKVRREV